MILVVREDGRRVSLGTGCFAEDCWSLLPLFEGGALFIPNFIEIVELVETKPKKVRSKRVRRYICCFHNLWARANRGGFSVFKRADSVDDLSGSQAWSDG